MTSLITSKKVRLVTVGVIGMTALLGIGVVLSQSHDLPDPETTTKGELTEIIDDLPDVIGPTEVARQREAYLGDIKLARENYREWLKVFKASGVDPSTLPKSDVEALSYSGPATLEKAVEDSAFIGKGVVTEVEFFAPPNDGPGVPYTIATLQVERLIKGQDITEGSTIEILFGGGPKPVGRYPQDIGPDTARISYFAAGPLLLQGEEAVLLLHESSVMQGKYEPLAWVGVNRIVAGQLETLHLSKIRDLFDGKPVDKALDILQDATESSP